MRSGDIAESDANREQDISSGRTGNGAISPSIGRRGVAATRGLDCYVRSFGVDKSSGQCRVSERQSEMTSGRRKHRSRRTSSNATIYIRRSAPKRRQVLDESRSSDIREERVDVFSLLIKAAASLSCEMGKIFRCVHGGRG